MKYKIKYLPKAAQDILWISEVLEDYPNKAVRLFKEMEEKLLKLETMPYLWPVFPLRPKYRRIVLEDYMLFYTVEEQCHEVRVYRIIYSRMDMPKQLKD